jgi:hypothetical protein
LRTKRIKAAPVQVAIGLWHGTEAGPAACGGSDLSLMQWKHEEMVPAGGGTGGPAIDLSWDRRERRRGCREAVRRWRAWYNILSFEYVIIATRSGAADQAGFAAGLWNQGQRTWRQGGSVLTDT